MSNYLAYGNKVISGGGESGSTGGGHIIEDASGTELTQQPVLKFKGGLKATDNSTDSMTEVDDSPTEIEWSVWNTMTDAQKEAIPKALVVNAPGVDGPINIDLMTKLWENSDPSVAFAPTNISLTSSDYDVLLWVFRTYISTMREISIISTKGSGTFISIDEDAPNNKRVTRNRVITRNSDTSFGIANCNSQIEGNASYVTNDSLVPVIVYGIKKSISIDVSAVISDVSTSADKCMLSDGVTSVEDTVVKCVEVTITNKSIGGNNKANLGSLTSGLPSGSKLVSWIPKSGFDTDLVPYLNGGNLLAYNINSSAHTISTAKVDVFYI